MKLTRFLLPAACFLLLLSGCSGGSAPLKELADTYAEIAENLQKITEGTQAVIDAPRDEKKALEAKNLENAQRLRNENQLLAEKAASIAEKLQGTEIRCEASEALGVKVTGASFYSVNADNGSANIVIKANTEGAPAQKPYYFLMDGKEVLYKAPATCSDGEISVNFRILTTKGSEFARTVAKTEYVLLVTESEYRTGAVGTAASPATEPEVTEEAAVDEPEPTFQGLDEIKAVSDTEVAGTEIKKGANLVAVLKAAKNVTYEYNADSGIWAHIGNIMILIDEDQLNQKGTAFLSGVYSDIEPNLAFSPDYLKPDAKILHIEKE